MPFRPMPLLDFQIGIYEGQEPWRAPKNAFVELDNAHVLRGRLLKRKGYTKYGILGLPITETNVGNGGDDDSGELSNDNLLPAANLSKTADTFTLAWDNSRDGGSDAASTWTDSGNLLIGLIVETVALDVSGDQVGATDQFTGNLTALNNPRDVIDFADSNGTPQTATVPYVSRTQLGSAAVPITGDVHASGTNTWTPCADATTAGTYDITWAASVTTPVTATYDRIIGTIVYSTGVWSVDYTVDATGAWTANEVDVAYEYNKGNPVMGIKSYFTRDGSEYLVAFDTERMWRYSSTTERFEIVQAGASPDTTAEWGGTNVDFFQSQVFEDILYINNNVDVPKKYTNATAPPNQVDETGVDFVGDSTDSIESASSFIRHKGRAIYFNTMEETVQYSQRARYTPVDDLEYSAASATLDYSYLYSDAPSEDRIVFATELGDNIIVGMERSIWVLRYNGDPRAPYEWERLPAIEGATGRAGWVSLGTELMWRGNDGLKITDGVSVQPFDFDIPELTQDWNQDKKQYSYMIFVPSERQILMTYAKAGDTLPQNILAIQLDEAHGTQSFSRYAFTNPAHCFGRFRGGITTLWDDVSENWDDITKTWDSYGDVSGEVFVLAGDRNSTVYRYADGFTDNGTEFTGTAKTVRINPVPTNRMHCSYVEIIADAVEGAEIRLLAYEDYSPTPYKNEAISLTPLNATDEKVIRQVRINAIANFHTFEIEMSGTTPVAIDQIAPYMKVAGPRREHRTAVGSGGFPYTFPFVLG